MTAIVLASVSVLAIAGLVLQEWLSRRREDRLRADHGARETFLMQIASSDRELLQGQIDRERAMAATERKELYSRIQAYDPNMGDFTPPSITAPPSRPGDEVVEPRSFTEEELGKLRLVEQPDGMIRDTRNDSLYETVEDWRYWQAELKKRNLPENVHPDDATSRGWTDAVAIAKARTVASKATGAAKN